MLCTQRQEGHLPSCMSIHSEGKKVLPPVSSGISLRRKWSKQACVEHKTTTGCRARSTSSWARKNLSWQLSRDGHLHGSGLSHAMTASPTLSFGASWRVGDAMVGRGNAGWTTSKSGHPCPCLNCPQGPPAEKTGQGSLLNRLSCPPKQPNW